MANERADAQQAIYDSLDDLKASLGQASDPRLWAKEHPWASLAVAAVAGFAAAAAVMPRRGQSAGEHYSHVAASLSRNGKKRSRTDEEDDDQPSGLMSSLFEKLFDLAKVAIGNLIMMQVQSRMAQYANDADEEPQEHADSRQPEHVETPPAD